MIKDFGGKNASRKTRRTPEKTRFLDEIRFPQIARHEPFSRAWRAALMLLVARLTLALDQPRRRRCTRIGSPPEQP
jgi:hypothetical protein